MPCFFAGTLWRFERSWRRARMSAGRVRRGSMTASRKPRSAAIHGFENFSRYSAIFSVRVRALLDFLYRVFAAF